MCCNQDTSKQILIGWEYRVCSYVVRTSDGDEATAVYILCSLYYDPPITVKRVSAFYWVKQGCMHTNKHGSTYVCFCLPLCEHYWLGQQASRQHLFPSLSLSYNCNHFPWHFYSLSLCLPIIHFLMYRGHVWDLIWHYRGLLVMVVACIHSKAKLTPDSLIDSCILESHWLVLVDNHLFA